MVERPFASLLEKLGLVIPEDALRVALTHSSYAGELPLGQESNERLEFLGDAVLDLAVADLLFRAFPERDEGELSKLRAVVVSQPVLAKVAEDLGLGPYLLLGKGEEESGGRRRPSVLASALEAVVGVAFLHLGYAPARALVERLLGEEVQRYAGERPPDYKSLLQELAQARFGTLPNYELLQSEGPEHKKVFTVAATLAGVSASGRGRSKKEAEQAAAKRLYLRFLEALDEEGRSPHGAGGPVA
ncbi:MAG: ribonuclease III [Candidatus Acetothermia bacterium]|jgi:ribonuclease-3|nr:ribonuclease III [Candidatus Acetothermia bacterium]